MELEYFNIKGLVLIQPNIHKDDRGFFIENFQNEKYENLLKASFVQDNISCSKKGVLRGLHFQIPPFDQGKLVQVLQGSVLDIAVDLRRTSPTYGQHVSIELNATDMKQFYIPTGFAHGFLALEDNTIFQYKCTNYYSKNHENNLLWDDPDLAIEWKNDHPLLSVKDEIGHSFKSFISPF